jgi:hypothetical protein
LNQSKNPKQLLGLIFILSSLYLGFSFLGGEFRTKSQIKWQISTETEIEIEKFRRLMNADLIVAYRIKGSPVQYLEKFYQTPSELQIEIVDKDSNVAPDLFENYYKFNCISYNNGAVLSADKTVLFRSTCPIPVGNEVMVLDLYFKTPPKKIGVIPGVITSPYDDTVETPLFRLGTQIAHEMI